MSGFKKINSSAGFTLIEIMLAAVILFSVITTVTMIYRGAILSSGKATEQLVLSNTLPFIVKEISHNLQEKSQNSESSVDGQGELLGIKYQWRAEFLLKKAPLPIFDIDSGQDITQSERYKLWRVSLVTIVDDREYKHDFMQVSWDEK